jgi:hypothetical protein
MITTSSQWNHLLQLLSAICIVVAVSASQSLSSHHFKYGLRFGRQERLCGGRRRRCRRGGIVSRWIMVGTIYYSRRRRGRRCRRGRGIFALGLILLFIARHDDDDSAVCVCAVLCCARSARMSNQSEVSLEQQRYSRPKISLYQQLSVPSIEGDVCEHLLMAVMHSLMCWPKLDLLAVVCGGHKIPYGKEFVTCLNPVV